MVFGVPLLVTDISPFSVSKPGLGVRGIDPGMTLTPFLCSVLKKRDSIPRPCNCSRLFANHYTKLSLNNFII